MTERECSRREFIRTAGAVTALSLGGMVPGAWPQSRPGTATAVSSGGHPYQEATKRIPFTLNGCRGSVSVFYGANDDAVASGFDLLAGLGFDARLCRGYPVMRAWVDAYSGSGYRTLCGWVQIITDTFYDSYDAGAPQTGQTVSIDVAPAMSELAMPFAAFGSLPQIFDAPCRNLQGHARLKWLADTFLTTLPGRSREEEIGRLVSFRWGYVEYDKPEQKPVSLLPLEITEADAWNRHLPLLRTMCPAWRLGGA
jgi:hypothetical protein